MSTTIRVGVVGYGWVAGAHIDSFNDIPDCSVTAVCSRRKLDPEELSSKHGSSIAVYNDYERMLAEAEVDVVSICTPHHLHADLAVLGAQAGMHLVIEKPAALNLEDIRRIETAVAKAGVKTIICFEGMVIGHSQMVRDIIGKGLLGEIHYGEVDYFHGIGPWYQQYGWNIKKAMGGSSLLTAGCHAMHGLLWMMGSDPVEVMTYGAKSAHPDFRVYEYPTSTVSILRFENGAIGKCASVIDCLQPYDAHLHLVGSKGSLLNGQFYTEEIAGLNKEKWSRFNTEEGHSGDVKDHAFTALFIDFMEAIREDRAPIVDLEKALFTHRVCLACDQSAETGKPVTIREFIDR